MSSKLDHAAIFAELSSSRWQIDGQFYGKDIVSIEQFSRESITIVLRIADKLEALTPQARVTLLTHRSVVVLFYQPSTRTYISFIRAAQSLGADVVDIHGMDNYSSAFKGESLPDTVRTIEQLGVDLIVLRHFDDDSAFTAAQYTKIPIINAGSGKLEHPTQALLDLRTIVKETGRTDFPSLDILFVGDLKNGRTVHSLCKLLAKMGVTHMTFVSPDVVRMPRNLIAWLQSQGVTTKESSNLRDHIASADVIYDTRVQKEWFKLEADYRQACLDQRITPEIMSLAKPSTILMHPLPRVDEISAEVDPDPRAVYFRQVGHGLFIRMALLVLLLSNQHDWLL